VRGGEEKWKYGRARAHGPPFSSFVIILVTIVMEMMDVECFFQFGIEIHFRASPKYFTRVQVSKFWTPLKNTLRFLKILICVCQLKCSFFPKCTILERRKDPEINLYCFAKYPFRPCTNDKYIGKVIKISEFAELLPLKCGARGVSSKLLYSSYTFLQDLRGN